MKRTSPRKFANTFDSPNRRLLEISVEIFNSDFVRRSGKSFIPTSQRVPAKTQFKALNSKITTIRGLLHDRAEGLVLPLDSFVKVFYRKGKFFLCRVDRPLVADEAFQAMTVPR